MTLAEHPFKGKTPANYRGGSVPVARRDAEVTELAVDKGIDREVIAKQFGISSSRVGQILDKTTGRMQVLKYLYDQRDRRHTSKEIAQALRVDINKIQYSIHNLQKKGKASFKKKAMDESGDHMMMHDVYLTPTGIAEAERVARVKAAARAQPEPDVPSTEAAAFADQAVADAALDEAERRNGVHTTKPSAAEAAAPSRPYEDIRRGGRVVLYDEAQETPTSVPARPDTAASEPGLQHDHRRPATAEINAETDTPVTDAAQPTTPTAELQIAEIPRFPLLVQLTTKNEKLQAASKLVESAGYVDLAITVLQNLDDFTPIEKEMLQYIALHGRPDDVVVVGEDA